VDVHLRSGPHTLHVQLTPDGPGFAATVEGVEYRVGPTTAGPRAAAAGGATVEELALEVDGRTVRVLLARVRDRVLVALDGRVYTFETGEEARAGDAEARSGAVTAPMPGKVLAVLVAAGDQVEPGQPLVILEAMKMETTLAAEVSGRVAAVHAVTGASVDAGELLVQIH